MTRRVLALDLASSTGWSCGSLDPTPVAHGILKLPKTGPDIGRFLSAFREWLGHAIEEMAPGEVIFEAPILLALTNITTLRKLYGLAGVTELVSLDYKLPVREANLSDIRTHFIGVTRAPKSVPQDARRAWLKARTVAECRARGFRVASDDDADSLALLSFALSLYDEKFFLKQAEPIPSAA